MPCSMFASAEVAAAGHPLPLPPVRLFRSSAQRGQTSAVALRPLKSGGGGEDAAARRRQAVSAASPTPILRIVGWMGWIGCRESERGRGSVEGGRIVGGRRLSVSAPKPMRCSGLLHLAEETTGTELSAEGKGGGE